jgi:predicted MFS family arabinose efflux permease
MNDKSDQIQNNRMLFPTLFIAYYANWSPTVISSLLLIEIAESFNAPIGITGQMNTFSSALAIFAAIFAGLLSAKYGPRKLLLTGLMIHIVSGIGSGISPNLVTLFLAYSMSGIALAIVGPMVSTLVGEHIPIEKRPNAMSWLIVATTLPFVIGSPIIGYVETLGGWRLGFYAYHIPIVVLALLLAYRSIPESEVKSRGEMGLFSGIRGVLTDRSARSCLAGIALAAATYYSIFVYSVSFFRVQFNIPLSWATIIVSASNILSIIGTLSGGRMVNLFGRKSIAVFGCALAGLTSISFVLVPSMWVSLGIVLLGTVIFGLLSTAFFSLSVEQVPEFRGSMMSLVSAFMNLGMVLGASVGGFALIGGEWVLMGVFIGVLGLLGAAVLKIWAVDPITQTNP